MLKLRQETALNLTLEGTTGSFRVGGRTGQQSLGVKYFLTHVGLDFSSSGNDPLLSALMPVREMFDTRTLDFDEIMQRDIDDARVSSELIPYLLDEYSREMIKLFPPIVVVVLPVEDGQNRPSDRYPAVTEIVEEGDEYSTLVTRSGSIGHEAFQFEQPLQENHPLTSDLVRLKLNTHKTRLVIVDGQHRAMALLAIYRNLREQWSDARRAPFKEYYAEWTQNYIRQFNIAQINLPVMLCTIPELDDNYNGGYDLKRAARSIFLTLNKTARQVSDSRNKLLDDNDLIAYFMRRCLSQIKRKDELDKFATRIWNVELDQYLNKVKLQSPLAITGVSHVYYIIEHLMLESGPVSGIQPRSGKFSSRRDLTDCMDRLDGLNRLGASVSNSTKRNQFSIETAQTLGGVFDERYGTLIVAAFDLFFPYAYHCRAALGLRKSVESGPSPELLPILFDGQGIGRVFEAHRQNIRLKLTNGEFKTDAPEIRASVVRLDGTAKRLDQAVLEMRRDRANYYIEDFENKKNLRKNDMEIHDNLLGWINGLYENVFNSVAFQTALICGFFSEIDRASIDLSKDNLLTMQVNTLFISYIEQLNAFFVPKTVNQLKKLLQVFYGEIKGETPEKWQLIASNQTFRSVVYRGEMQPDQWPKYKYLLLEIWKPDDKDLVKSISAERQICRMAVFRDLYYANQSSFLQESRKAEAELNKGDRQLIFDKSFNAYIGLMKNLGLSLPFTKSELREVLNGGSNVAPADPASTDTSWNEEE